MQHVVRSHRCGVPLSRLSLVALLALSAGAAGCNPIDWHDVIDEIKPDPVPPVPPVPPDDPCARVKCGDGTQCVLLKSNPPQIRCEPVDHNPCATINCGINAQCIVLESYPPQAKCVPLDKPEPQPLCRSSAECAPDHVCSVEQGDCQSPPGCAADRPCPAVCYGKCVPAKVDPTPGECKVDADCKLHSNYCGGCSCSAYNPDRSAPASCPASDAVACFADPCLNHTAVCKGGQCVAAGGTTPAPRCTDTQLEGSESSCKPADLWKKYATENCARQNLVLGDFGVGGGDCDGGTRYMKYTCCSASR